MLNSPSNQRSVSEYSKLLHVQGWVANHDGNVSVRLPDEKRFMATPTAMSKRCIEPHDVLTIDIEAKVLSGRKRVFSEWHLHAACYRARPDVGAVIHAHPPFATAFAVARKSLGVPAMPEIIVSLGASIPLIPYALPKSKEQDLQIEHALKNLNNAMLISANGALTVGVDLEQAYLRLELVEHYAKIVMASQSLGGLVELGAQDVEKLVKR